MTLRRDDAGWSHGRAEAPSGVVTIQLRPGWRLGEDGRSVVKGRQAGQVLGLPAGAKLVAAMPASPKRGRGEGAAEAALERFVQLRLPPGESAAAWLEQVRRWRCVLSAQLPPSLGLP